MSTRVPLVVTERPAVCPCGLAVKALGTGWSGRAAETSLPTPTTANEKSHQREICENSSLRKSCFVVSKIMNEQHMEEAITSGQDNADNFGQLVPTSFSPKRPLSISCLIRNR